MTPHDLLHARGDNGTRDAIQIWRFATSFLLGVVVTLLGAWATHGVTKDDVQQALTAHDTVNAARLAIIETKVTSIEESQAQVAEQIEKIRAATFGEPEVTVRHFKTKNLLGTRQ